MAKPISLLCIAVLTNAALLSACQKTPTPPVNQTASPLADDDRVVRIFDIDDLLKSKWFTDAGSGTTATQPVPERMEPDQLIARIKKAIGWKETDGTIQIRDGKLIVNGTRKTQQQIFNALNGLRTGTAAPTPKPAPVATTQSNPAAPLKPGDTVRVSIYDLAQPGNEYLKEGTISDKGMVDILYLGKVEIDGLTPAQAAEKIGRTAVEKHALLPAGNGAPGPQVSVTRADAAEKQAWNSR